ncbi:hypothetical protein KSS87_023080 [Heliosperma pusillum]|nr:hypothetical protein KSS87_023080 [Heliosperma pusillum]
MDIDYAIRKDEPAGITETSTPDAVDPYEKWERSNRLSIMFIKTNICASIRGSIDQHTKVKDLLKAIDEQFATSDKALASTLIMQFTSMKHTETKGVDEVDIDMGMQKVTVNGYADQKKILKAARQSGRRAELWQFPYQPELRSFTHQYPNNCQGNGAVATSYSQPQASSSYNYFKHGYDGHEYHGFQNFNNASYSSSSYAAGRTGDVFSDENPHACSIM